MNMRVSPNESPYLRGLMRHRSRERPRIGICTSKAPEMYTGWTLAILASGCCFNSTGMAKDGVFQSKPVLRLAPILIGLDIVLGFLAKPVKQHSPVQASILHLTNELYDRIHPQTVHLFRCWHAVARSTISARQ
jgi:hypothetical protein